ncbi:MAG: efflux RND transporter periplasmic adaptor subunit [Acidobacteria bacterium]|nr:efflux RND transporter periplasmic adaptor subunit [Acidobacteriota bacterium]
MERKRNSIVTGLAALPVVALILALSAGYTSTASAQNPGLESKKGSDPLPAAAEKPGAKKAAAYVVDNGEIVREVVLTGELKARNSTMISAPRIQSSFSNTVTYLAPEGAMVKKGERIVEFDDSSLLSQKSEAERTLDEAKLNIQKKKADLEAERCDLLNSLSQAESSLKQDELYGRISKDLLPANTYQKYQLNVTKSKLSLQKAREQMDNFEKSYTSQMALVEINRSQAEINLKKIESDMQVLKIDAPQDGILIYGDNWASNRKVQTGDNIFPGMEVASLPDLSSMQVLGFVYDTEYSTLSPGQRCRVRFDALPGYEVGGVIESLTSVAGRKGFASEQKVFQTVVRLDKVDVDMLKPGMTAQVDVPLVLAGDAPAIPREYLGVDNQGRQFVLKGADLKQAKKEFVEIGAVGDKLLEVLSGVKAGDRLIAAQYEAEVSK